jgi:uncharacterized protein YecA (UPF0149 family)
MQSHSMSAAAFEIFHEQRPNIVHHEHLRDGQVRVHQAYTGQRAADIHAAMDADQAEAQRLGSGDFHRTKIGRNAPCPCRSGRKFKKCCIGKATVVR